MRHLKKIVAVLSVLAILVVPGIFIFGTNYSVPQPRLRVNRTSSLGVTTSWQTIDFNGSSSYNVNTFGQGMDGGQMVRWDTATKLFRVSSNYDDNFTMVLYANTTTNLLTTRATLQYRIVVPNGISSGVPLYFPYPDDGGYADLGEITIYSAAMLHKPEVIPIYVNSTIRTNGFYIQMRLSNSLITLGTCTLNSAALLIQSTR